MTAPNLTRPMAFSNECSESTPAQKNARQQVLSWEHSSIAFRGLHAHFDTGQQLLLEQSNKVQSNSVIMSKPALLHVQL